MGKDGSVLAVVEAKKTSKDAGLGREQAKQYCYNIRAEKGGALPFCFYTNGHEIYFWNLEHYPPMKVFGFPHGKICTGLAISAITKSRWRMSSSTQRLPGGTTRCAPYVRSWRRWKKAGENFFW